MFSLSFDAITGCAKWSARVSHIAASPRYSIWFYAAACPKAAHTLRADTLSKTTRFIDDALELALEGKRKIVALEATQAAEGSQPTLM